MEGKEKSWILKEEKSLDFTGEAEIDGKVFKVDNVKTLLTGSDADLLCKCKFGL